MIRKIFESELEAYCNGAMEFMAAVPVITTSIVIILALIKGKVFAVTRGLAILGAVFAILCSIGIIYRKTWMKNTAVHFLKRKSIYELLQGFKSIKLKNLGWYYKNKIQMLRLKEIQYTRLLLGLG